MIIMYASVLEQQHGADIVYLWTDLPDATYPFTGKQTLEFRCAKGTGTEYLRRHFPRVKISEFGEEPERVATADGHGDARAFHKENHWSAVPFDQCAMRACREARRS